MTGDRGRASGALLALACILLLAVSAAATRTRSYDFGWHLATGTLILERGAIPRVDEFSFTSGGTGWADHEWLFQVIAAGLFGILGHAGFTLIKAACALGAGLAGWRCLRDAGCSSGSAMAIAGLSLFGLRSRLGERPEAVSLMMAALAAWLLLDLSRGSGRRGPRLLGAFLLAVLWANLHAAALLAPVLGLAVAAGAWLDARLEQDPDRRFGLRRGSRWALTAALVMLAGLAINPFGLDLMRVPLRIGEALGPSNLINPEWLPPGPAAFPLFFACALVVALLAATALARRLPGAGRATAMLAVALPLGLLSVRHTGLFFALLPAIASGLALAAGARLPSWQGASAALALSAAMFLRPPDGGQIGVGLQQERFPEEAADFLDAHMPGVRAYNDTAFGGYLIWRGWPGRQVFLDGRNEVHASLLREISGALDDGRRWSALLERHGVEAAVVSYRNDRIPVRQAGTGRESVGTFSETHFPRGAWALVHWDRIAMVFVKRDGRYATLADEREYRHIRPEAALLGLVVAPSGPEREATAAELRRKMQEDPDCPLARTVETVYGLAP